MPGRAKAQASRYDFWFTRLKYDSGDWDVDARMPSNLITSLIDYTSLRVRGKGDKQRMVPILEFLREKILH